MNYQRRKGKESKGFYDTVNEEVRFGAKKYGE